MDDLLEADIRKAVEKELYSLRRYRVQLRNLQIDLIDHPLADPNGGGKCNLPGDPTGIKAVRQVDIKNKIVLLSSHIAKIENALSGLTDEDRALIELRYISDRQHNNRFIMDYLSISQAQYYRRREEILKMLAEMLWPREIDMCS